jgi:hypothetical protein
MKWRRTGVVRLAVATGVAVAVHAAAVLAALGDVGPLEGFFRHPDSLIPAKTAAALVMAWIVAASGFRRALGAGSIGPRRAAWAAGAALVTYVVAAGARALLPIVLSTSHKYGLMLSVMPPLVVGSVLALPRSAARPARAPVSLAAWADSWRYRRSVAGATVLGLVLNGAVIGVGRVLVMLHELAHGSDAPPAPDVARIVIVAVSYVVGMTIVFAVLRSTQRGLSDRRERFVTGLIIAGLTSVAALTFFPYAKGTGASTLLIWVVATMVAPPVLTGLTFAIGPPPPALPHGVRS